MTIVVFLLVLRQVPQRFEAPPRWAPRVLRVGIAVAVGGVVALFAALVSGSRTAPSSGISYADLSLPEAGGKNIVNVVSTRLVKSRCSRWQHSVWRIW
jgi:multicomponent Na+:H+ antiporter subunit A